MAETLQNHSPTRVVELVVNLDDTTGERLGHAVRLLLDAGALDVWTTPIAMKKDRPGVMLSVLVEPGQREVFARDLLEMTGSFGLRMREWDRLVLDRDWVEVRTRLGTLKLKVGRLQGRVVAVKPEFEQVAQLARQAGVSIIEAQDAALAAADAYRARHNANDQPAEVR